MSDFWSCSLGISPHPPDELPVELLGTTLGHIRPALILVQDCPLEHAPDTDQARHVEEYHRVAFLKSRRKRAGIIPVHDPRVTLQHRFNSALPLGLWHLNPAGIPVDRVEVDNFYIEGFTQVPGESGLANSAR